ncbi:MAG: DUF2490 domain-containing protein [Candidatus Omnitrophica bacterium]|nr:DUF2490 domain-containing protein [Candidatus Omnitrophota bacterium]
MKKLLTAAVTALCLCLISGPVYGAEDGDWQFWQTDSVSYKISDAWKVKLEEELWWTGDMGTLTYMHTDAGLSRKIEKWLSAGFNYRQAYSKSGDKWYAEHRPHFNLTGTVKWKGVLVKDRARLEYRIREDAEKQDSWRFRNKTLVYFPLSFKKFKYSPYLGDEIFFTFSDKRIGRNRVYAGLKAALFKGAEIDLYYMSQSDRLKEGWKDANVIGAKLNLTF